MRSVAEFMVKVAVAGGDECWLWTGYSIPAYSGHRRGRLNWYGKGQYASRVSYMIHVGPIPDGLCVLHRCDNPMCVRPDHLFLGDRKDNAHDMLAKRRHNYNRRDNCEKCGSPLVPTRNHRKSRFCLECNKVYQRLWARRKRAESGAKPRPKARME